MPKGRRVHLWIYPSAEASFPLTITLSRAVANSAQRNHGADVRFASSQPILDARLCSKRASGRGAGLCREPAWGAMGRRYVQPGSGASGTTAGRAVSVGCCRDQCLWRRRRWQGRHDEQLLLGDGEHSQHWQIRGYCREGRPRVEQGPSMCVSGMSKTPEAAAGREVLQQIAPATR